MSQVSSNAFRCEKPNQHADAYTAANREMPGNNAMPCMVPNNNA